MIRSLRPTESVVAAREPKNRLTQICCAPAPLAHRERRIQDVAMAAVVERVSFPTLRRRGQSNRHGAGAGEGAQERFELLRQRWRRRKSKTLGVVFGALLAPCAIVGAVASGWWDITVAFVAGAWVGVAMWIWDTPPEYIERLRRGAEGERRTARELRSLEAKGWFAVHDVAARFGNWDHVAVGPGGVFLLDSKNLLGEAGVEQGCLTVRRVEAPEEVSRFDGLAARMRGAAAGVSRVLEDRGARPWVTPIVVVWPELAPSATEVAGVQYISGTHLTEWLTGCPARLDQQRCAALQKQLAALADEASTRRLSRWNRDAAAHLSRGARPS
jgi:Nuclease-related domain